MSLRPKKRGGRKTANTQIKKMRTDLAKIPKGRMFGVQKFMDKYTGKENKELYLAAQEEYTRDERIGYLARGDVDALREYQRSYGHEYDLIEEKHGLGRSHARNQLDAQVVKMWLEIQEPRWNRHRMVWFAEELTNQNFHTMSSYVAYVEIAGIPEEIWREAEIRGYE